MNDKEWKKHIDAYHLYDKLVDILIGYDVEIALLALQKCKLNLMLCQHDHDSSKN